MQKWKLLANLDAIREVVEKLPDDVRICNISNRGMLENEYTIIQILRHPDVTGERVYEMRKDEWWCERPGPVAVGWIEDDDPDRPEDDDETAV